MPPSYKFLQAKWAPVFSDGLLLQNVRKRTNKLPVKSIWTLKSLKCHCIWKQNMRVSSENYLYFSEPFLQWLLRHRLFQKWRSHYKEASKGRISDLKVKVCLQLLHFPLGNRHPDACGSHKHNVWFCVDLCLITAVWRCRMKQRGWCLTRHMCCCYLRATGAREVQSNANDSTLSSQITSSHN